MIRALCFDLYETLVTEAGVRKPRKEAWAARLGLPLEPFWVAWKASKHSRMTGVDADFAQCLRRIVTELGYVPNEAALAALAAERVALKRLPFDTVDAAILALLAQLRARGTRICVVSNCAPEEVAAWPTSPLAPLVDASVWSYAIGVAKPDPAIYHYACWLLDVPPTEVAFIGDGGSDELAGAARVGMAAYQATWFARARPGVPALEHQPYPQLSTPEQVLAIIAG
jgi:HAD superfamily hydrolase (TIGR01509 family)